MGATVITRYGNYRTHKIEQIDFNLSPLSEFECKGTKINFKDYFRKAYGAEILDMKQPLIKVQSKIKRFIGKDQKINEDREYIYLVPELVSMTGMRDDQRANHESMKALAPFTKLSPDDRFNESLKIIETLNQSKDTIKIGREIEMNGFVLPQPTIYFKESAQLSNGNISNRGYLHKPHKFENWVYAYSSSYQQDYS